ncbi:hypothetical protein SNOG_06994 [Parastagonospora nodorum SN15]|uniref:Uncharacterized protein n=1 Tax=Phaeosphaeria nodorum (strain SN15 / ATCC MYA-4574 / FGSC 10173) TaxID=321614 RepID=Q0UMM0_PHANO|nr:hypothetical protein SNOG_06994 [Parastagonospora nodorum SN15]EAT85645.1 hypothetical protein SNOG_06994 [Parastagonospora nodorum SN15]
MNSLALNNPPLGRRSSRYLRPICLEFVLYSETEGKEVEDPRVGLAKDLTLLKVLIGLLEPKFLGGSASLNICVVIDAQNGSSTDRESEVQTEKKQRMDRKYETETRSIVAVGVCDY